MFCFYVYARQRSGAVVSPDRQAEQNKHVSLLTPPAEAVSGSLPPPQPAVSVALPWNSLVPYDWLVSHC